MLASGFPSSAIRSASFPGSSVPSSSSSPLRMAPFTVAPLSAVRLFFMALAGAGLRGQRRHILVQRQREAVCQVRVTIEDRGQRLVQVAVRLVHRDEPGLLRSFEQPLARDAAADVVVLEDSLAEELALPSGD